MAAVLSKRTKRRLRYDVAKRLVDNSLRSKRLCSSDVEDSDCLSTDVLSDIENDSADGIGLRSTSQEPSNDQEDEQSSHSTILSSTDEFDDLDVQSEQSDLDTIFIDSDTSDDEILSPGPSDELESSCQFSDGVHELESSFQLSDALEVVCQRTELFSGSSVTKEELSVALLSLFHKHSMTYMCVTEVLKLFSQVLPSTNLLPRTLHMLMSKFVHYDSDTATHHCCGYCTQPLSPGSQCSRLECRSADIGESSFIEVYLDKQLLRLFSGMLSG